MFSPCPSTGRFIYGQAFRCSSVRRWTLQAALREPACTPLLPVQSTHEVFLLFLGLSPLTTLFFSGQRFGPSFSLYSSTPPLMEGPLVDLSPSHAAVFPTTAAGYTRLFTSLPHKVFIRKTPPPLNEPVPGPGSLLSPIAVLPCLSVPCGFFVPFLSHPTVCTEDRRCLSRLVSHPPPVLGFTFFALC